MTLREKRVLFTTLAARIPAAAATRGWQVAFDQVKRTQAEADANAASGAGIKNSLHLLGLAVDILLYKRKPDGTWRYCEDTEDYRPLGEWWRQQHELCRWGGDFKPRPDGDHFSLEHEGVR